MRMNPLIKQSTGLLVGLAVVSAMLAGMFWAISSIWAVLRSIDVKLAVGLLTAVATVLGVTLTVTLGKYFERRQAVDAHFRERKVAIYDDFLKELFKLFGREGTPDTSGLVDFLWEWQRKLVVWGGSEVLLTYIKWKKHLSSTSKKPDAESMFLMGDFLLAMRKDLGFSNKGIDRRTFAHLILRNSDLLLNMASKNPKVTLAELASVEKERGLSDG